MKMDNYIYSLPIRYLLKKYISQNLSFWLFLLYIVFEYLRPQSMYPRIDIIPWTATILILLLIQIIIEGKLFSVKNKTNVYINLFLFVVLMSSVLALSPEVSLHSLKTFIILYIIYFLITYSIESAEKYILFIIFYILVNFKLSFFTFCQWVARGFAYDKYGATAGMAWLENSGEFAIQMCIVFVISSYLIPVLWEHINLPKKLILLLVPISCLGSVVACGSRGGLLAIASIITLMYTWTKKKFIGLILILIVVISTPYFLAERDFQRFYNIGTSQDSTGRNRLERWEKGIVMFKEYPVLGVGYANWAVADRNMFNGDGALCHNIFIECMSELGLIGLIAFILLIYSTLKNNRESRIISISNNDKFIFYMAKSLDISMVCYLVAGFFVTVFYYPFFWVNLGMTVALNAAAKNKYINAI